MGKGTATTGLLVTVWIQCPSPSILVEAYFSKLTTSSGRSAMPWKECSTKPAVANFLQQQARFEQFIEVFNHERRTRLWIRNVGRRSTNPRRVPTPGCRTSTIPCTTKSSWSLAMAASVWATSAMSLLDRPSGSKRFTTTYGWSALSGQLYELRFGILRFGDSGARTARKSLRPKSVTHVTGRLY